MRGCHEVEDVVQELGGELRESINLREEKGIHQIGERGGFVEILISSEVEGISESGMLAQRTR